MFILLPTMPILETELEKDPVPIMSEMTNQTAKELLGKSSWHLLHTMSVKYPLNPTKFEKETMKSFINSFSLLYPCGSCAQHFQEIIKKMPPKVDDRSSLVEWMCNVHNIVNQKLLKPIFNCSLVQEFYACGCIE